MVLKRKDKCILVNKREEKLNHKVEMIIRNCSQEILLETIIHVPKFVIQKKVVIFMEILLSVHIR
jgi:hypothetical protein